jgi:hypothetical protein
MSIDRRPGTPLSPADAELLDALRGMWELQDPVPADLAERVLFSLELEDLEFELLQLEADLLTPTGSRGEERARTVTFTSESLSVMVTISPSATKAVRLDGWIAAGGGLQVELRFTGGGKRERADEDGRFVFDQVGPGMAQLLFHPTPDAEIALVRTVVTPAIQV